MNHKLTNGMMTRKGNTTSLLFSPKDWKFNITKKKISDNHNEGTLQQDALPQEAYLLINLTNIILLLLIENKLIICALGNLHYMISREKWHPSQEGDLNMSWHENQDSSCGRAPG